MNNNPKIFRLDFKNGTLQPFSIQPAALPIGQMVAYEDRANPYRESVIISAELSPRSCTMGQPAVCLEDGHLSEISMTHAGELCGHWRLINRILSADELAAALTQAAQNKERLATEAKTATTIKAQADAAARVAYLADFPYLEQVSQSKKSGHALAAANLKKELARQFPGVKFSVKSDSYSGGDSVDVKWTDGPLYETVDKIARKYSAGKFDGMEDIYNYQSSVWTTLFGDAKYVSVSRDESPALRQRAADELGGFGQLEFDQWGNIKNQPDDERLQMLYRHARTLSTFTPAATSQGDKPAPAAKGVELRAAPLAVVATAAAAPALPSTVNAGHNTADSITVRHNKEKNGIEIKFADKPAAAILDTLKNNGWRWSRFSSCWYHRANVVTLEFAANLAGIDQTERETLAQSVQGGGAVKNTFPVLPNTGDVYLKWQEISNGTRELTEWDKQLFTCVEKAVAGGIFFSEALFAAVCLEIPVTPEDLQIGVGKVERGCFGYEIYSCRKEIEKRHETATRREAAALLTTGQVFKNLQIGAGKFSTILISAISPNGFVSIKAKKRGSPSAWEGECSALYFAGHAPVQGGAL